MDLSKLPNPYDHRNPVRKPALFAGRGEELAVIEYELGQVGTDRSTSYIAIHGQRGAGKTSLLNRIEHMARDRGMLPVRVELVSGDETPAAFYRKMYEELVAAMETEGALGDSDAITSAKVRRAFGGVTLEGGLPLEFPEALALGGPGSAVPETALRRDLAHFVQALGRPIALLVDEAQRVAGHEAVLSILRALGARLDGFVFVLAGTPSLLTRITEVFSPLSRQFAEIKVERFVESGDVRSCMLLPLLDLGLDGHCFADLDGTVSELIHLTDGNPYEIQLYCHEMFARWQTGAAPRMRLTTDMLVDVRRRMEQDRAVLDRPLIRAVRGMSPERLEAFNVLCSAMGHATVDEVWFAHCLVGEPAITREALDRCRAELVAAGVLVDDEVVRLAPDTELFDEIYTRLWAVDKLGPRRHPQLIRHGRFNELLARRLSCTLHDLMLAPARPLRTCCAMMNHGNVEAVLEALETLTDKDAESVPPTTQFVHEAILATGIPSALDITTVTCTYGDTTVARWLYSADADDFDLEQAPVFAEVARRVAELGGELRTERIRLPLKPWPQITRWLRLSTGQVRKDLASNHLSAFFKAYGTGDFSGAQAHLSMVFELDPTWQAANNLCYMCLVTREAEADSAAEWAGRALELAADPKQKALSQYNAAMAQLLRNDRESSRELLMQAAATLASLLVSDYTVDYLLLPCDDGGTVTLEEETKVDLAGAVDRALAVVGPAPAPPEAPAAVEPPRPKTVLVVATEWQSAHGGLSTFNRDLCRALAAAGAQVHCMVLAATDAEVREAREQGVTLLCPPAVPGVPEYVQLTRRPNLPEGAVPDLVIGHGRITGPAAAMLVSDHFDRESPGRARRLHFIHMAPDEIEWHKLDRDTDAALRAEERTEAERRLGADAHRVVAVGPRLHERFLNELSGGQGLPPLRLDPGFDAADLTERTPPAGAPLKVLLVGRTEDAELKGLDLAARACGLVAGWRARAGLVPISLLVRGAPEDTADVQRAELRELAGNPRLEVVVRPYSAEQDRLAADMGRASLVVMPSRSEGFGLVGLEAITTGVPTLVSENSGLAELLREVLDGDTAGRVIVPMSGDDEEDAQTWARSIDAVMRDLPAAFRRAAELRAAMAERVTWARAAALLLAEVAAG